MGNSAFTVAGTSTGIGTLTSITATAPIVATPSDITSTGVISMQHSAVTAGTYPNATVVVDQFGIVQGASTSSGSIIQVVQTHITTQFSTSSTSYVDVTGLTVTITPSSGSSKILLLVNAYGGYSGADGAAVQLVRNSTPINIGGINGSNIQASASICFPKVTNSGGAISINYVDSPATTSAVTYKIQAVVLAGGTTLYIGQSFNSTSANYATFPGNIIAMEIVG